MQYPKYSKKLTLSISLTSLVSLVSACASAPESEEFEQLSKSDSSGSCIQGEEVTLLSLVKVRTTETGHLIGDYTDGKDIHLVSEEITYEGQDTEKVLRCPRLSNTEMSVKGRQETFDELRITRGDDGELQELTSFDRDRTAPDPNGLCYRFKESSDGTKKPGTIRWNANLAQHNWVTVKGLAEDTTIEQSQVVPRELQRDKLFTVFYWTNDSDCDFYLRMKDLCDKLEPDTNAQPDPIFGPTPCQSWRENQKEQSSSTAYRSAR